MTTLDVQNSHSNTTPATEPLSSLPPVSSTLQEASSVEHEQSDPEPQPQHELDPLESVSEPEPTSDNDVDLSTESDSESMAEPDPAHPISPDPFSPSDPGPVTSPAAGVQSHSDSRSSVGEGEPPVRRSNRARHPPERLQYGRFGIPMLKSVQTLFDGLGRVFSLVVRDVSSATGQLPSSDRSGPCTGTYMRSGGDPVTRASEDLVPANHNTRPITWDRPPAP